MIEISHKQAQRWLRIAMDRHLPNEQWTPLQAHLENCAQCRAYRDHLGEIEKDIRRTLQSSWEAVPGPAPETSKRVLRVYRRRQQLRQRLMNGARIVAGLALVLVIGRALVTGDLQKVIPGTSGEAAATPAGGAAAQVATDPAATPIPTARAGDFPDVLVYQARLGGRADGKQQIFLLNPGSDPVDLFDGSSNDTDPVWSPDGQWIAFLSDRGGKPEIYVTSLVSNKVVQLSSSPGVAWEGPLSWSADGQWLALTGVRDQQGGERWVYVVGVDGAGARPLTGGRGGMAPKFAPSGDRLAFTFSDGGQAGSPRSGVTIYHLETGESVTTAWPENPAALAPAPGSALDWSADGSRLVYIAPSDSTIAPSDSTGATNSGATNSGAATIRGAATTGGVESTAAPSILTAPTATAAMEAAAAANRTAESLHLNETMPAASNSATAVAVTTRAAGATSAAATAEATATPTPEPGGAEPGQASPNSNGSQVLIVRDLNTSIALSFDFSNALQVAESTWPGAYRAVSWTPGGVVLYTEDLGDARANDKPGTTPGGCWTIQARQELFSSFFGNSRGTSGGDGGESATGGGIVGRQWSVNGVCVEGGLDRQSWTPDGRWVVVLGRLPSTQQRALYAIRMPGRGFGYTYRQGRPTSTPTLPAGPAAPDATPSARLLDSNLAAVGSTLRLLDANWVGGLPRVRPRSNSFNPPSPINPLPVAKTAPALAPSDLSHRPDGPNGQIVYTVQNSSVSAVVKANPDGTGGQILAATSGINRCPRFSADGQSIALVAPAGTYAGGRGVNTGGAAMSPSDQGDEVYVMDADGGNVRQVSMLSLNTISEGPIQQAVYGCPVWSPSSAHGGPFVAALLKSQLYTYLAVMPASGPSEQINAPTVRITFSGTPLEGLGPQWSPDGSSIYLVARPQGGGDPKLLQVNVPDDPLSPLWSSVVNIREDWTRALALSVDPSGSAFLVLEQSSVSGADGQVMLRRISFSDPGGGNLLGSPLALSEARGRIISGQMTLLFNSRSSVGLYLQGRAGMSAQGIFYRDDLSYGLPRILARVEDPVNALAWSPDGRWVVYSAESGLWGLDMAGALEGRAAPVWLSPVPVDGLDWR